MPVVEEFFLTASTMQSRTVFLSGDTSALLFSAIAALSAKWQWTSEDEITPEIWDQIEALLDKGNDQLMTTRIGDIVMYTSADAPPLTLPCDGEQYDREDYSDLYAVLDAAYIVDADTFVTPALQSRSPIGAGQGAGLSLYEVNQVSGEENHELTESENASHVHSDTGHDHLYSPPGATGLAVSPGELPVLLPSLIPASTGTGFAAIQSSGSGTPHNTIHPVNAVKFAIYYQ